LIIRPAHAELERIVRAEVSSPRRAGRLALGLPLLGDRMSPLGYAAMACPVAGLARIVVPKAGMIRA
jgi:hypothetical protein